MDLGSRRQWVFSPVINHVFCVFGHNQNVMAGDFAE